MNKKQIGFIISIILAIGFSILLFNILIRTSIIIMELIFLLIIIIYIFIELFKLFKIYKDLGENKWIIIRSIMGLHL